jgi:hypothetical protein
MAVGRGVGERGLFKPLNLNKFHSLILSRWERGQTDFDQGLIFLWLPRAEAVKKGYSHKGSGKK